MKRKLTLVCALLAFMLSPESCARCGETLKQCIDRYGDAEKVKTGDGAFYEFTKSKITIRAAFDETGQCNFIFYQRAWAFTSSEVAQLLKTAGAGWEKIAGSGGMSSRWQAGDLVAIVPKSRLPGNLVIAHKSQIAVSQPAMRDFSDLSGF